MSSAAERRGTLTIRYHKGKPLKYPGVTEAFYKELADALTNHTEPLMYHLERSDGRMVDFSTQNINAISFMPDSA